MAIPINIEDLLNKRKIESIYGFIIVLILSVLSLPSCMDCIDDDILILYAPDNFLSDDELQIKNKANDLYINALTIKNELPYFAANKKSFREQGIPVKYYRHFVRSNHTERNEIRKQGIANANNLISGLCEVKENYFSSQQSQSQEKCLFDSFLQSEMASEHLSHGDYMSIFTSNLEENVIDPELIFVECQYLGKANTLALKDLIDANLHAPILRWYNVGSTGFPKLIIQEMPGSFSEQKIDAMSIRLYNKLSSRADDTYLVTFAYKGVTYHYCIFFDSVTGGPILNYNIFGTKFI